MTHNGKWIVVLGCALLAAGVARAGALPTGGGPGDILPPLSDQRAWSVADTGGLEAGILETRESSAETFGAKIYKVDGNDSHASIVERNPINLIDGHRYTLTLLARANTARDIRVTAISADRDHRNVGLDATLPIGFGYQAFTESFVAHNTSGRPSHVAFAVGQTTGNIWLQQVNMVENGPSETSPKSS